MNKEIIDNINYTLNKIFSIEIKKKDKIYIKENLYFEEIYDKLTNYLSDKNVIFEIMESLRNSKVIDLIIDNYKIKIEETNVK